MATKRPWKSLKLQDLNRDGQADFLKEQDLNGDGRKEVIAAWAGHVPTPGLPSNGISPRLSPLANFAQGPYPEVKTFDLNGDGTLDQWCITFGPKGPRIIFHDPKQNGKPEAIGVDVDCDGDQDAIFWDDNEDGNPDHGWIDRNGDGHIQLAEHVNF
jgi:hypothetical protein